MFGRQWRLVLLLGLLALIVGLALFTSRALFAG